MLQFFRNDDGKQILMAMVKTIQDNKAYLGEVDGLIGDGDHGMNMNKGFSLFEQRYKEQDFSFTAGLEMLGNILLAEIGGSMGPIYGTLFTGMAEAGKEEIDLPVFTSMLDKGIADLYEIVDARVGDKTLIDTLVPAMEALRNSQDESFSDALTNMSQAAENGKNSTKELTAKYGRSSRLGERSRGVYDAGAVSCFLLITAMAESIKALLDQ